MLIMVHCLSFWNNFVISEIDAISCFRETCASCACCLGEWVDTVGQWVLFGAIMLLSL